MTQAKHIWSIAWAAMVVLLGAAFWVASLTQGWDLLSLTPPATDAVPTPEPDTVAGATFGLYASAYTAWAALVLLIPAYVFVWMRNQNDVAWSRWLAFWTAAWVAYVVHLAVSMGLFFQWDFGWMTSSSRVSAFWPGMIIAVWWPIDIVLALRGRVETKAVKAQRVVLHIATFILFVGGSAVKGELVTIKVLGGLFAFAALWGATEAMKGGTGNANA